MFGPHLILEGYKCQETSSLANETTILHLLQNLPSLMKMNIIMPPQVTHYDGGDIPEDCGVSGFVIIAESHIAIHTFPQKAFFTLDIFSCQEFEVETAISFINSIFRPESCEHRVFSRGKEFPRCLSRSERIVSEQREIASLSPEQI